MTRTSRRKTNARTLAEYTAAVVGLLKSRGAVAGVYYDYVVETPAGPLHVSPYEPGTCPGLWVHARFDDPDRAKAVLYPGQTVFVGSTHRLNPHSGKWNFTSHEAFMHEFARLMGVAKEQEKKGQAS